MAERKEDIMDASVPNAGCSNGMGLNSRRWAKRTVRFSALAVPVTALTWSSEGRTQWLRKEW